MFAAQRDAFAGLIAAHADGRYEVAFEHAQIAGRVAPEMIVVGHRRPFRCAAASHCARSSLAAHDSAYVRQ
jgi:hypothetical protein